MARKAKALKKALSQYRLKNPTDEQIKKDMATSLQGTIKANVIDATPLEALNELSEAYNAVLNKKIKLKLHKDPQIAGKQENAVLHALQVAYKDTLDKYLAQISGKSQKEKAEAVKALKDNHQKIITQVIPYYHHLKINFIISTILQATNPEAVMPQHVSHAPSENLNWQDQDIKIKTNIVKTFAEDYLTTVRYRAQLVQKVMSTVDRFEADRLTQGITLLDTKLNNSVQRMKKLSADSDKNISDSAKLALQSVGLIGKVEDSFLHQLLSGFKNPEKIKPDEAIQYTEEEIVSYARSLLAIASPLSMITSIHELYLKTQSPLIKREILNNAMVLLHELIIVDNAGEIFPDFTDASSANTDITQALTALITDLRSDEREMILESGLSNAFERTVRSASDLRKIAQEDANNQIRILRSPDKRMVGVKIDNFITNDLQRTDMRKSKILDTAKIAASDFKKMGIAYMMNMKATDLYKQAWAKDNKENTNVLAFIHSSGKISNHVATDILSATSVAHQMNIAYFYAMLLKESIRINDYATASAILAGFSKQGIFRLTHIKDDKEIAKVLDEATELLSPKLNSKNLRAAIAEHKNEVVVPFIGIYLTDLTMADEKIKNLDEKKDINVKKLNAIGVVYNELNHMLEQARKYAPTGQNSNVIEIINKQSMDNPDKQDALQFDSSREFRAKTIPTPRKGTLAELLAKFPDQKVPLYLEISLVKNDKEQILVNKKAYKAILKLIIEKAEDANSLEKAAAYNLVKNLLVTAQKNGLATERVQKLVRAAMLVTDTGAASRSALEFVNIAAEEFYKAISLKAELEGHGDTASAKSIASKAEDIRISLEKATKHEDKSIAAKAKRALETVNTMISIPILSEQYKVLAAERSAIKHGKDSLAKIAAIQDKLDAIEEKLRNATKSADPRIRIPATLALADNQIAATKTAFQVMREAPAQASDGKKPAMLMSQHRKPLSVVEPVAPEIATPKSIEPSKPAVPVKASERVALAHFIADIEKAKGILNTFYDKPKYINNNRCSLVNIIKQIEEENGKKIPPFHNPNFNISYTDYSKYKTISTLEYVKNTLNNNPNLENIERLISETSKQWPEGNKLLVQLKEDLIAEGTLKVKVNPRASKG